jgi:septation ring formation regulator EzrA
MNHKQNNFWCWFFSLAAAVLSSLTLIDEVSLHRDVRVVEQSGDTNARHLGRIEEDIEHISAYAKDVSRRLKLIEDQKPTPGPTQVLFSPEQEKRIKAIEDRLNKIEPAVGVTGLDHLSDVVGEMRIALGDVKESFTSLHADVESLRSDGAACLDGITKQVAALEERVERLEKRKCPCLCCHPKGER